MRPITGAEWFLDPESDSLNRTLYEMSILLLAGISGPGVGVSPDVSLIRGPVHTGLRARRAGRRPSIPGRAPGYGVGRAGDDFPHRREMRIMSGRNLDPSGASRRAVLAGAAGASLAGTCAARGRRDDREGREEWPDQAIDRLLVLREVLGHATDDQGRQGARLREHRADRRQVLPDAQAGRARPAPSARST